MLLGVGRSVRLVVNVLNHERLPGLRRCRARQRGNLRSSNSMNALPADHEPARQHQNRCDRLGSF